jgi:hypothetical protein
MPTTADLFAEFDDDGKPTALIGRDRAGTRYPVSGDGVQSAVRQVLAANPRAGGVSGRWRVSRGPAGWNRVIDLATPLASGLWRVQRIGIEDTEGMVRLYDTYIASRAVVEDVYITNDATSEPAIINVAQPSGGGWQGTTLVNPYTTTVGDTVTFSFTGTGLDFRTQTDNRGGVWTVEVDGAVRGSFSTWTSSAVLTTHAGIVRGLPQGNHTCVLRFAGADPLNAPAGGVAARGWIARATTVDGANLRGYGLARVADLRDVYTVVHQLMFPGSNVEAAIQSRLSGQAYAYEFWPKHGSAPANTQIATAIYVDGAAISTTDLSATWSDGNLVEFFEQSRGYNQNATGTALIEFSCRGQCAADGYAFRATITALQALDVNAAYVCMAPAQNADRVVFDTGEIMDVSAHNNGVLAAAKQSSSGWLDDPARHGYCLAWAIDDPWTALRLGQAGSEPSWTRVQTRSDGTRFSKGYPFAAAAAATVPQGAQWVVSGRLVGGVRPV